MDATRRVQLEDAAISRSKRRGPGHRIGTAAASKPDSSIQTRRPPKRERPTGPAKTNSSSASSASSTAPSSSSSPKSISCRKDHLLPLIDSLTRQFNFAEIIPVSARKRDGLDILVRKIVAALPDRRALLPQRPVHRPAPALHGRRAHSRKHPDRDRRRSSLRLGSRHRAVRRAASHLLRARKAQRLRACRSPASPPPSTASATGKKPSSSARAAPSLKRSAPAPAVRSSPCSAPASISNCASSSSPAGANQELSSNLSTGATSSSASPATRSPGKIRKKKIPSNRSAGCRYLKHTPIEPRVEGAAP